ncbi:hypothetical protein [Streptomyces sp. HGB0020]|uniref:phage tail tube protein n=1 Tax=Streptomyces sp. HGB0020 TaxID=1078086 RepID=UPI00034E85EB|nr:hypothetical protein [Streptomyces sp. HGB0020]EPD63177.1 hypothetical protein HMPREF1211_03518 [Streptomyces sp. HGB0020]
MPAWETLKKHQNELIRKQLEGSTFIAPITSSAISTLTGADKALLALPAGYNDVGWMSDDGAQFSSDVSTSDVTSWGAVEPTRRDITSDVTTLQCVLQETNKQTIGLYTGVDMSAVVPDPTSGEVAVSKPDRPPLRFWRVLTIGVDLSDAGEIYMARFLPRASVSDKGDQAFSNGDDPTAWDVTLTGYMDSTLGYSERFYFGGPGWEALLTSMGF